MVYMNMDDIKELAEQAVDALADYPHQDPSEIIEEIVAVIAREEGLTRSQTTLLYDCASDLARG